MTIQTSRMTLYALTPEQLKLARHNLALALSELSLYIEVLPHKELQQRRQIYKEKCRRIDQAPEHWLLCTTWQMALETHLVVGEVGFKGPPEHGTLEIGYGTESPYRNRGYMKEAVTALCAFGLSRPNVERVEAFTKPDNLASQHVLLACGFRQVEAKGRELRFLL